MRIQFLCDGNCGNGICREEDQIIEHILYGGKVCGRFVINNGPCNCNFEEEEQWERKESNGKT